MRNIRYDGKSRRMLFWICFFSGLIGAQYFYLNQKKLGWISAGISWVSATLATFLWVIYASVEVGPDFNYELAIVLPTILLLVPLMGVFVWSMYLCVKIATGSYLDETKTRVDQWKSSEQDVLNYYLEL